MSKASGAGRGAAGRRKANGVNASPLRLGGLYSRRSLSSPRGSAAPPDARPYDDISLMSRTHLIQSAKSAKSADDPSERSA